VYDTTKLPAKPTTDDYYRLDLADLRRRSLFEAAAKQPRPPGGREDERGVAGRALASTHVDVWMGMPHGFALSVGVFNAITQDIGAKRSISRRAPAEYAQPSCSLTK